jgi:hypothetical protein
MKLQKRRRGVCTHWMLLGECPCEVAYPGGHRGPAMNGLICDKFELSHLYKQTVEEQNKK